MSNYTDGTLLEDESVMYVARISLWTLTPYFVFGLLFCLIYFSGLLFFLIAYIRYKTTELAITNKRVIAKFGFISRHTVEINIRKVESIQVSQSILGRIFGFGSLIISGAGNPQAPIPGISDPMNFRRAFMKTQNKIQ